VRTALHLCDYPESETGRADRIGDSMQRFRGSFPEEAVSLVVRIAKHSELTDADLAGED
jgi:hypothetical protein